MEHVVRTLLKRWGVIFWRLMAAEADWLPSWREIVACCRRLEARGEIRGGRFVAGFSGEQYASPEAVALLREARQHGDNRQHQDQRHDKGQFMVQPMDQIMDEGGQSNGRGNGQNNGRGVSKAQNKDGNDGWVSLSAADPLNLLGILTPGPRLPALTGNRLLYRDGLPVATLAAGEVRFLVELDEATRWQAQTLLVRTPAAMVPQTV